MLKDCIPSDKAMSMIQERITIKLKHWDGMETKIKQMETYGNWS